MFNCITKLHTFQQILKRNRHLISFFLYNKIFTWPNSRNFTLEQMSPHFISHLHIHVFYVIRLTFSRSTSHIFFSFWIKFWTPPPPFWLNLSPLGKPFFIYIFDAKTYLCNLYLSFIIECEMSRMKKKRKKSEENNKKLKCSYSHWQN